MAARPSCRLTAHRGSNRRPCRGRHGDDRAGLRCHGSHGTHAGDNDFRLNATSADNAGFCFQATPTGGSAARWRIHGDRWSRSSGTSSAEAHESSARNAGHAGSRSAPSIAGGRVSRKKSFWQITESRQRNRAWCKSLCKYCNSTSGRACLSLRNRANVMWLVDSQLLAPGLELLVALQEGYRYIRSRRRGSVNPDGWQS